MTAGLEAPNAFTTDTSRGALRFVTATSLFDGHDASINIFRRILQDSGTEVIHLGHDRSVEVIARAAVCEDAHAVAVTSYQGGHMEFYRYLRQRLDELGGPQILVFGGGGGTILPDEQAQLADEGTARIFSPDDGRRLGMQGMIDEMLEAAGQVVRSTDGLDRTAILDGDPVAIARAVTAAEEEPEAHLDLLDALDAHADAPVVGVTGTGGAGKSSLVDELLLRMLRTDSDMRIGVLSVDPSRRKSGGALLGDRIRMNSLASDRVFMRSLATRQSNLALSPAVGGALAVMKAAPFDLVILETSGIGQSDTEIVDHGDVSLYVMTPDYGAATQLEKIDMLDFADLVAINKADTRGARDALRDVRKQVRRNRKAWDADDADLGVFDVVAARFADPGVDRLHRGLVEVVNDRTGAGLAVPGGATDDRDDRWIVPPERVRYLSEITEVIRADDEGIAERADAADRLQALRMAIDEVARAGGDAAELERLASEVEALLDPADTQMLEGWDALVSRYRAEVFRYDVRGREIEVATHRTTLADTHVPRVATPGYRSWGDRLRWANRENYPGSYPFTAGVFPFKREGEDPTRMFAGEGGPEQTNRRFHYLAQGLPAVRLSTAFDSVTLYGHDPDTRPDIWGKVGNSGVSIATLDDAKKLYSGFDLCDPKTSVSMTINGPAPTILAFFLNAAIDQQCERWIVEQGLEDEVEAEVAARFEGRERPTYHGDLPPGHDGLGLRLLGVRGREFVPADVYEEVRARTLSTVRGTVQADILKEDQAQNTCIFSTEFAIRCMGDVQQYFVDHAIGNFYSVSVSGYHMAEAGANAISHLAFTLANGFTYVEYYLSRGMDIDDFAPSLSFFFSNGIDPEFAVVGRVARRIWARAMKLRYGAGELSQKLKYHVQTSGRSLHAQEIAFNDIRTTLQALYAVYDNANSLHTNAYDEAITTPTEESVRRALAIQLIINRELGLAKNENPLQGSFVIDELTDLVEEAVLTEFDRLTERGGVLGAMERQYQRTKIQEESMRYEHAKETGEYPIVGVNTFLGPDGSPFVVPEQVVRSDDVEKQRQVDASRAYQALHADETAAALARLQETALAGGNVFEELMETVSVASLGQISDALFEAGGRYRRNM
jgi:methylmalonyl-CoA mutase